MTNRKPKLVITNDDIAAAELPQTMPILVESNQQQMVWERGLADALAESELVEEQIESANRIHAAIREEADRIYEVKVSAAAHSRDREYDDADKVLQASVTGFRRRQEDIARNVAGFRAALTSAAQ